MEDAYLRKADVAKLADALDLGSSGAIHVGSTPIIRTAWVDKLISWLGIIPINQLKAYQLFNFWNLDINI